MARSTSIRLFSRPFFAPAFYLIAIVGALSLFAHSAAAQSRMQPRMQRSFGQPDQSPEQPRAPAPPEVDGLGPWLKRFHEATPQTAVECVDINSAALTEAADAVEQWILQWSRVGAGQPPQEQIAIVGRLIDAQQAVSRELDNLLAMRVDFAKVPDDDMRHNALRGYLRATSTVIDLSGRLRYALVDTIDDVADRLTQRLDLRERLIDLLIEKRSSAGAQVMSVELFDVDDPPPARPLQMPPTGPNPVATPGMMRGGAARRMAMMARMPQMQAPQNEMPQPTVQTPHLSVAQKIKLLHLQSVSGNYRLVDDLADFVLDKTTPPTLVLAAAETIRDLGIPQDPRPEQEKDESVPKPAITAAQLRDRLMNIEVAQLPPSQRSRLESLIKLLSARIEHGLDAETYRIGSFDVQPGDWLLMRNPSPYNLFTDLSPGLFTHVGVVAMEKGSDGKRRMVVVDLPEQGTTMPATNVDAFLKRTLNYVFVRHPDPAVAKKMGEVAATLIGNPTQFDLNFRTDRIAALQGKIDKGQKIHTYCAGFLLVCAQETGSPRDEFFPITETTAGGHTKENLAKLGLSLGDGFVSPTGALFSPQLQIVGHGEPMYEPTREIEEAIYDHFAQGLEERELHPSPDLFQSLRLKVAEAAKNNPLLTKALAATAGVNEQMDLVSAAKAAAVVETLDSVAYGASGEFQAARRAIIEGGQALAANAELTPEQRAAIQKYRARHADLAARWDQQQLSPRGLRLELVQYYRTQGCHDLDERFFAGEK